LAGVVYIAAPRIASNVESRRKIFIGKIQSRGFEPTAFRRTEKWFGDSHKIDFLRTTVAGLCCINIKFNKKIIRTKVPESGCFANLEECKGEKNGNEKKRFYIG
jgi:hypothetical protein